MAAQPTAVVTTIHDIVLGAAPNTVDLTIVVRLLFTPLPDSVPLEEQLVLVVPDTFSKNDVRVAAHASIIASVADKGAVINSNRIFGVDDLV